MVAGAVAACSESVWNQYEAVRMQGTVSSKKKKQAKLKRVMQTVKKHERKAGMHPAEAFAAMQLLHDPQVLAVDPLPRCRTCQDLAQRCLFAPCCSRVQTVDRLHHPHAANLNCSAHGLCIDAPHC